MVPFQISLQDYPEFSKLGVKLLLPAFWAALLPWGVLRFLEDAASGNADTLLNFSHVTGDQGILYLSKMFL